MTRKIMTDADRGTIILLRKEGMMVKNIAYEVGFSRQAINVVLRKAGMTYRKSGRTEFRTRVCEGCQQTQTVARTNMAKICRKCEDQRKRGLPRVRRT